MNIAERAVQRAHENERNRLEAIARSLSINNNHERQVNRMAEDLLDRLWPLMELDFVDAGLEIFMTTCVRCEPPQYPCRDIKNWPSVSVVLTATGGKIPKIIYQSAFEASVFYGNPCELCYFQSGKRVTLQDIDERVLSGLVGRIRLPQEVPALVPVPERNIDA
jgi:hypothetical protein